MLVDPITFAPLTGLYQLPKISVSGTSSKYLQRALAFTSGDQTAGDFPETADVSVSVNHILNTRQRSLLRLDSTAFVTPPFGGSNLTPSRASFWLSSDVPVGYYSATALGAMLQGLIRLVVDSVDDEVVVNDLGSRWINAES